MDKSKHFRLDIQGLRGVAVLLVIIEHTGGYLSGGYIGVDVFFVISGFVITDQLVRALRDNGQISLVDFYSRRVRRLLPASTIVILSTLILSLLILSPGIEHDKAAAAGIASMFFIPNLRYIFEGGYFFLAADPFRHFWSLGVEEQFYMVYPALFLVVYALMGRSYPRFRRTITWTVVIFALASFALATVLTLGIRIFPLPTRLSFFGTPFRMWELLVGAIVSIVAIKLKQFSHNLGGILLGICGTVLIFVAAFFYDEFTIFPGTAALPPVVGTALLLIAGSQSDFRLPFLEWRPLTYIGDISYGLYLWHWPLIVFARRLWPNNEPAIFIAVFVAIVLSGIQYQFIETPIRRNERIRGKQALSLFVICSVAVVGVTVIFLRLSQTGLGLKEFSQFERTPSIVENCNFEQNWEPILNRCSKSGDSNVRVMLIGDSQAAALGDGFVAAAEKLDASYSVLFGNSCPIHARPNELRERCDEFHGSLKEIIETFSPQIVFVANASDLYVTRGGFGKPDTRIRDANGNFPKNYEEALDNWLAGIVTALTGPWFQETQVVYVQMSPNPPLSQPSLLRREVAGTRFKLDSQFDQFRVLSAEREALSRVDSVLVINPANQLCTTGLCSTFVEKKPIYADAYHLNSRGSLLLEELFRESILTAGRIRN